MNLAHYKYNMYHSGMIDGKYGGSLILSISSDVS